MKLFLTGDGKIFYLKLTQNLDSSSLGEDSERCKVAGE